MTGSSPGSDGTGERMAANRRNWEDRVPIHLASRFYDVDRWLRTRPGPREREVAALGDVDGLDLVHLQCHFGLDTLAWADAGARVTGIDFSPSAIEAASHLARRAGLDRRATFVCANVYDAAAALSPATFDIVYVSLGALCWLPSVERWADQVAALARPGGRLYLHDSHPLAWSLAYDTPILESTYFEEPDPYVEDSDETYTDADEPLVNVRSYEWNHSVGEVVTALVERGLRIDTLVEHDWTVHQRFPWLIETAPGHWTTPPGRPRMPLTFTVVASRMP
jgi:SAM-dependent methyltransferase